MTNKPATVAAEITLPCTQIGRSEESHSVFIHRDGSVTAPNHLDYTDQQVLTALGEEPNSACAYWLRIPSRRGKGPLPPPEGRERWRFTYTDMWTTKAAWTALTGILGQDVPGMIIDPVQALEITQAFLAAGPLPNNTLQVLTNLAVPVTNERGWRRTAPIGHDEVAALLAAGVPADRVGAVAAMGVSPEVARQALTAFRKARVPAETLVYLANAVDPDRIPALVGGLDVDGMDGLLARVSKLREALRDGVMLDTDGVFDFLAGRRNL